MKVSLWGDYRTLVKIFLVFYLTFFLLSKIDLTTSDLGRHIKNGEIILKEKRVFQTNYYSYTHPNFYSPNHHWGSGVVFFLIYKFFGFKGLSFFLLNTRNFLVFAVFCCFKQRVGVSCFTFCGACGYSTYSREKRSSPRRIYLSFHGSIFLYSLEV